MKILISADMEGITGIVHSDMLVAWGREYERGRRLQTRDVNAAIKGAVEAGADEILVNDAHGSVRNLLIEEINPAARLISGFPRSQIMMEGLDKSVDAAVFVGYHAKASTFGICSHTMSSFSFTSISINGKPIGETGINAAIAGLYGVPLVAVSGDDCLRKEVAEEFPDAIYTEVKKVYGLNAADCLPPSVTEKLITENVKKGIQNKDNCKPFVLEGPLKLDIVCKTIAITDVVAIMPGVERVSPLEVTYTASDIIEVSRAVTTMMCATGVLTSELYK